MSLTQLRGLLRDPGLRIVTLVGPGGSGKTRVAVRAATKLLEEFREGVFFVDIVPLADARAVAGAVAGVLGVQEARRTCSVGHSAYCHSLWNALQEHLSTTLLGRRECQS